MDKRRSVLSAVLLSVPLPGLGLLYCGKLVLGIAFVLLSFAHWAAFIAAWAGAGASLGTAQGLWYGVFGLTWLASGVLAGLFARAAPDDYQFKPFNLWYFYLLVFLVAGAGQFGMFRLVGAKWLTGYELHGDGMSPGLLAGDWIRVDKRAASRSGLDRGTVVAALDPYDGQTLRVLRVLGLPGEQVSVSADGVSVNGAALERKAEEQGGYQRKDLAGQWDEHRFAGFVESIGDKTVLVAEPLDPKKRKTGSWRVPPGHLFLAGDNRIHAVDSRTFGPVPLDSLSGVVLKIWFSRDPQTGKARPDRRGLDVL